MDKHLLDMCFYVDLVDADSKRDIVHAVMRNKTMSCQFQSTCIGLVSESVNDSRAGFYISRKSSQLAKNIKSLKQLKKITGLREKYAKRLWLLDKAGFSPIMLGTSINHEAIIPVIEGQVKILLNDDNKIIIPSMLSYDDWIRVAKARHEKEYQQAKWPKRQAIILHTIRHCIGIYDTAWLHLPASYYGHICRQFVRMVCRNYPELNNVAKEWLEVKSLSEDVDILSLNKDYLLDSENFISLDRWRWLISELNKA